MSNPYGWGQNEPQIKPKDQGGDTIATFSQKIYNLFDNLFNTLNSYPWSAATQSDAGYMSAADKAALDDVPTTYLPLSGGTLTGNLGMGGNYPAIMTSVSNTYLRLGNVDYNGGASIYLNGKDRSVDTGTFSLTAYDGVARKIFVGAPDGTLKWGGKDIATYETGTWTPTLYGGSTAGTITNTQNYSYYIKLKDLIYVRFYFSWKITTAPAGEVRMGGLPYTPGTYYHGLAGCNTHICNYVNAVQNTNYARVSAYTPTTSVGSTCNWGTGSNTYNNWNNAVNATDSLIGWLLYRISA